MKRCSVKPYESDEKYIFVSYCHKDKAYVFPIIEQLSKDGYRIWYDEGIDPGSEWPEIIADHLNRATVCIAFISENSLASHNCRREINFALLKKKPFISVVIEEVQMSLGMEMQLSATQAIFKYKLPSETEFFNKLYEAKFLSECLGTKNSNVVVSNPMEYQANIISDTKSRNSFSDTWFLNTNNTNSKENVVLKEESAEPTIKHWLVYEKNAEKIILNNGVFNIGRSASQNDYTIVGNSMVGRTHTTFKIDDSECVVIDNSSKNGTYVNNQRISSERPVLLKNGDIIKLVNELFSYHKECSGE